MELIISSDWGRKWELEKKCGEFEKKMQFTVEYRLEYLPAPVRIQSHSVITIASTRDFWLELSPATYLF